MNVDIAYRLSKLRRERNLSQEALANQLGVSRQAVSKWERAESSPDTDNLIALADLYGMSLDDLLKGDPEANDVTREGADAAAAEPAADAEEADSATGQGDFSSEPHAENGGDYVHMNLHDGINVHDHTGVKVHVGWDGVHVDDPNKGDYVDIDGCGVHVNDHEGNSVHSNENGSVEVNGRRYDSWADAHDDFRDHSRRGWMSRFPYAPLALTTFLCMGIFLGLWAQGLVVLFSTGVWTSLGHLVDVFRRHRSARKKRAAVTAFVGACSIFSFLAVGLLAGMWHPGWVIILAGLVVCGLIDACWRVDERGTSGDGGGRVAEDTMDSKED